MDYKRIIEGIDRFFNSADEKAIAEVRAAFAVEIEGDITIEEYFGGFGNRYFYTPEVEANCYSYPDLRVETNSHHYQLHSFEAYELEYDNVEIAISSDHDLPETGDVGKMIKKAA